MAKASRCACIMPVSREKWRDVLGAAFPRRGRIRNFLLCDRLVAGEAEAVLHGGGINIQRPFEQAGEKVLRGDGAVGAVRVHPLVVLRADDLSDFVFSRHRMWWLRLGIVWMRKGDLRVHTVPCICARRSSIGTRAKEVNQSEVAYGRKRCPP